MNIRRLLSHDAGAFWQFVKYGMVGVLSTCVQTVVFYICAATCLKCLAPTDWAVQTLHVPAVTISDALRAWRFAVATGIGFVLANVFCWLMNRWFVFKPGKFRWYVEFALFFGVAALAAVVGIGVSTLFIRYMALMTTLAVLVEVVVSFLVNFFIRKFMIFKG